MRCDEGKARLPSHADAIKRIIVINASIAEKQARGAKKGRVPPKRAYLCPHCGQWHITSQDVRPGSKRRRV